MKTIFIFIGCAAVMICATVRLSAQETIPVGVLLESPAQPEAAGMQLHTIRHAEQWVNRTWQRQRYPQRLQLMIEDLTTNDIDNALIALKRNGVQLVVGPTTSEQVRDARNAVEKMSMVLISHGSTAMDLAKEDRIFRTVPSDHMQVKALVQWLEREHIAAVIPLWRGDAYGDAYVEAVREAFGGANRAVVSGVRYDPGSFNVAATMDVLDEVITETRERYVRVAVLAVTFGEIGLIMEEAAGSPACLSVPWMGCDGNVMNPALTENTDAASVAVQVNFMSPLYTPWVPGEELDNLHALTVESIMQDAPGSLDPYTAAAWDAVWLAAESLRRAQQAVTIGELAEQVSTTAEMMSGLLGPCALDENGDRRSGTVTWFGPTAAGDEISWLPKQRFHLQENGTWAFRLPASLEK